MLWLNKLKLEEIDSEITRLIKLEEMRQEEKIILIASESLCPYPTRKALSSVFTNIYAEGAPPLRWLREEKDNLDDLDYQLALFRRYGDRRYYRGCEYVDMVEAIAINRVRKLFATKDFPPESIFANVQPLSGAAANNAVYEAFLKPGDVVMGMDLTHGGHLTHGSPANRSGKRYNVVSYKVPYSQQNKLDYEEIKLLALKYKPKLIIAGFSAYPWSVDWKKFREIADSVGALLLADIAHTAGLVVAGVHPNPVGFAHIVSFTTHKTLCGPRGAVILTTDPSLARKIDLAVFPGEQGGPHINNITAKAVAFKIAESSEFKMLQKQIVDNARFLADYLKEEGLVLAYGGTDTHMVLVDLKRLTLSPRFPLKGEIASRILDLCGIVCNKNTIAGDTNAAHPSAIRLGTTWVTQRGMGKEEMKKIAQLIARILKEIHPFRYLEGRGYVGRGKIKESIMKETKEEVKKLVKRFPGENGSNISINVDKQIALEVIELTGPRVEVFLQGILPINVFNIKEGEAVTTFCINEYGKKITNVVTAKKGDKHFYLFAPDLKELAERLSALSDGYIVFDSSIDIFAKIEGPVRIKTLFEMSVLVGNREEPAELSFKEKDIYYILCPSHQVEELKKKGFSSIKDLWEQSKGEHIREIYNKYPDKIDITKPYFIGQGYLKNINKLTTKEEFYYSPPNSTPKKTALYDIHKKSASKIIPFAGWLMPLWYAGIKEEHKAVRERAGLFDVGHMGIIELKGKGAGRFLDLLTTNYVLRLLPGQATYSYFLGTDGIPLDDILIYCFSNNHYMVVVNAVNHDKILAWLKGVKENKYIIDTKAPWKEIDVAEFNLLDLKDPSSGKAQKMDLALQGPATKNIVASLLESEEDIIKFQLLERFNFFTTKIANIPVIISRTGYTGEEWGYEFYIHPHYAEELWGLILEKGKEWGVVPAGLGARDSTRTEAGLPLYGHELAGDFKITPQEAGYGAFVKLHKPFFVGRTKSLLQELYGEKTVIRFKLLNKNSRPVRAGSKVADERGKLIGKVTSCTVLPNGEQVGMAYMEHKNLKVGDLIYIFPTTQPCNEFKFKIGEKVILPEKGKVIPRFMGVEEEKKEEGCE